MPEETLTMQLNGDCDGVYKKCKTSSSSDELFKERATPSGIERGSVLDNTNNYTTPSDVFKIRNTLTTRKNWHFDAPIILPGWECTRGSRSTPTVPECLCGGKPWVAHQRLNCGVGAHATPTEAANKSS